MCLCFLYKGTTLPAETLTRLLLMSCVAITLVQPRFMWKLSGRPQLKYLVHIATCMFMCVFSITVFALNLY